MLLTTKVHIGNTYKDFQILSKLCYHSARLYNVGLYSVRQHFFNTGEFLSYYDNYHLCKINENYSLLLTDTGQQILRLVDRDMHSFFGLLKLKKIGKYSNSIHLPKYKGKEELMTCSVQGRSVRMKEGKARIGLTKEFRELYGFPQRYVEFTIPKNLLSVEKFNEVRIIPQYGGKQFSVEFIYDSSSAKTYEQSQGDGFMSIDMGIDNLMACTVFSNGQPRQFLIDGRYIKSINAYYNKTVAKLKGEYSKNKGIENQNTKRMLRLMNGRTNRINDYFCKAVSLLVQKCIEWGVTTVVVGYNKEQKQSIEIGKVNNQNFVSIPLHKLRQKLQYKCELHGIKVVFQEESYTSKSSCLDLDEIPVFDASAKYKEYHFSGKRIKRGLYLSKNCSCINADINGSVNILRKYFNECKWNWLFQDHVRALVNGSCQRVNPLCSSPFL